jgi:hypothetical protein
MSSDGIDKSDAEFALALQEGLIKESTQGYFVVEGTEKKFRRKDYIHNRPEDMSDRIRAIFTKPVDTES